MRLALGPVFAVELVAAARRWQHFAVRTAFLLILFLTLTLVWANDSRLARSTNGGQFTHADYANLGESFATAVLCTQLALLLLAAPAATAGAICLDKARGNLLLLFATDVTGPEIVFGKLTARLWPVLGLVAASLPVLFISALMGGVGWDFLAGAFLVMVCSTVLACTVAFLISVYVAKTHEALMLTYLWLSIWLLTWIVVAIATMGVGGGYRTVGMLNPFWLMSAPSDASTPVYLADYAIFVAATLGPAVLCALFAAARLRTVVLKHSSRPANTRRRLFGRRSRRLLDRAPMAWYERHRRRPSRAAMVTWGVYIAGALAGIAWTTSNALWSNGGFDGVGVIVSVFGVGIGLLLATVSAVTGFSDERTRGGLDILLSTPIASASVVRAKWWSAFKVVLWIVVLPVTISVIYLIRWSDPQSYANANVNFDQVMLSVAALILHPLACGMMLASFGLFLAVRLKQFGRAVGLAVAFYVTLALGWIMLIQFVAMGSTDATASVMMASPMFAQGALLEAIEFQGQSSRAQYGLIGAYAWSAGFLLVAAIYYWATLVIFDRRLGRIPDAGLPRRVKPPTFTEAP